MRERLAYANVGSFGAYLEQKQGRDYVSELYNRGKDWFIEKPYKGLGILGAGLGFLSGLAFGPLGALFGATVVGGMGLGYGSALYWGWTRGKRKPRNTEFDVLQKDGRSFGKYLADYIQAQRTQ